MQKLRRNEVNVKRNLEFKKERDEFLARLRDEKMFQLFLENKSATKIQAAFRGYKTRPKPETFDKTMYRRYEHILSHHSSGYPFEILFNSFVLSEHIAKPYV